MYSNGERRTSFACTDQNIKGGHVPTALEKAVFRFEQKRNETLKYLRKAQVTSAEELGTMSKSKVKWITLVRGPICGTHFLYLGNLLIAVIRSFSFFYKFRAETSSFFFFVYILFLFTCLCRLFLHLILYIFFLIIIIF